MAALGYRRIHGVVNDQPRSRTTPTSMGAARKDPEHGKAPFLWLEFGFEAGSEEVKRLVGREHPDSEDEWWLSYEPSTGRLELGDWRPVAGDRVDWDVWRDDGPSSPLDTVTKTFMRRITSASTMHAQAFAPSWSPNGTRIASERDSSTGDDLYTVRPDGTGLRRLTTTPGLDENKSDWAPGAGRVPYDRHRRSAGLVGTHAVFAIRADGTGTGTRKIFDTALDDLDPHLVPQRTADRVVQRRPGQLDRNPPRAGIWTVNPDGTSRAFFVATPNPQGRAQRPSSLSTDTRTVLTWTSNAVQGKSPGTWCIRRPVPGHPAWGVALGPTIGAWPCPGGFFAVRRLCGQVPRTHPEENPQDPRRTGSQHVSINDARTSRRLCRCGRPHGRSNSATRERSRLHLQ